MGIKKLVHAGEIDDDLVAKVYRGGWSEMVLSSDGGDIYSCRAIVDYLLKNPKPVLVTGKCFSSATAIAVAAKYCNATPGTRFMVHHPDISNLSGKSDVIAREKEELDVWYDWFLKLLTSRTDTPRSTWEDFCKEETYMGTKVALELGLIDGIEE